jgi:hypothetical protein
MTTYMKADPKTADWYYSAILEDMFGETDHIDGYAVGDKPTQADFQEWYGQGSFGHNHSWVAGMMHVHDEDLDTVSKERPVSCEVCDLVYGRKPKKIKVINWEVVAIPKKSTT